MSRGHHCGSFRGMRPFLLQSRFNSKSDREISGSLIRHASNPPPLPITTSLNLKPAQKSTDRPRKPSSQPPLIPFKSNKPSQPTSPPPPPPTLPLLRHLLLHDPYPQALRLLQNLPDIPILHPSPNHLAIRRVRLLLQRFIKRSRLDGVVRLPEPLLQDADDLVHGDRGEVAEDDEPFEGTAAVGHGAERAAYNGHFWGSFWLDGWMDGWMDGWRCGWRC